MIDLMVGETRFELATLCSQSRQVSNEINASPVNQPVFGANRINGLQNGCKLFGVGTTPLGPAILEEIERLSGDVM